MAYDQGLAQRVLEYFESRLDLETKKMFGGLGFLIVGNMCCGVVGDKLMARVGPDEYEACLKMPHVAVMDFTGKSMKGFVYVLPEGLEDDSDLAFWLGKCEDFINTLTPKL
ncbi:TfoX/Sxy family protein [Dongshaea marina]|uniref:TfoX/Sxy family protein n=1 Tax=Dongshaea marina TaxID=2047966 RepID=UPI000D3E05B3|nr:TfoX/Sxy family protein [Dongshaea marina]